MSNNFSKNIKFLRKKMGLNQEHIASLLNVARNTYSNYESGRNEPSFDMLIKISKIFNCTVDSLLTNSLEKSVEYNDINKHIEQHLMEYLVKEKEVCTAKIKNLSNDIDYNNKQINNINVLLESLGKFFNKNNKSE